MKVNCSCGQTFDAEPESKHRLLCGSVKDSGAFGEFKAGLCLTDPPYGVGEKYDEYEDSIDSLKTLIKLAFPILMLHSERILLTPGNSNQRLYPDPDWTLCWFVAAGTGRNPWGFTCWQPVLAYGKCPYLSRGDGSRPDALAMTESANNELGHPCSKPLKVWSWLMERGSAVPGELVFDPFLGSGTTMVASENLGRRCFGIDISPGYCAVVLERMHTAFPALEIFKL